MWKWDLFSTYDCWKNWTGPAEIDVELCNEKHFYKGLVFQQSDPVYDFPVTSSACSWSCFCFLSRKTQNIALEIWMCPAISFSNSAKSNIFVRPSCTHCNHFQVESGALWKYDQTLPFTNLPSSCDENCALVTHDNIFSHESKGQLDQVTVQNFLGITSSEQSIRLGLH